MLLMWFKENSGERGKERRTKMTPSYSGFDLTAHVLPQAIKNFKRKRNNLSTRLALLENKRYSYKNSEGQQSKKFREIKQVAVAGNGE